MLIRSKYLPIASGSDLGAVKIGSGLSIDGSGILSVSSSVVPLYSVLYPAQSLDSPFVSDWAVASNAALSTDSANAGIVIRLFSDSAENGAGTQALTVPTDAVNLKISIHWRAVTSPGSTVGVVWKLYHRSENSTVSSWSSQVLTTASVSDSNWLVTTQTISLSTLGITTGDKRQFEITRTPTAAADTLAGNAALESVILEFL